jgi:hypothetical protein
MGFPVEAAVEPGNSSSSSSSSSSRMLHTTAVSRLSDSSSGLILKRPMELQLAALAGVQHVMLARGAVTCLPGWRRRCRGLLAAADDSSTDEVPDSPAARRDGRQFAPGVEPVLVLLLLIESACVACWDADSAGAAVAAALGVLKMPLQDGTPHNLNPLAVRAVLQHLWLGMGQTLLAAAGSDQSAAAEPQGGEQEQQQQQQGEQQAAGTSSSSSSSQQNQQRQAGRLYGIVDGVGGVVLHPVTAGAAQQKRFMWSRFATTLFRTFTWMADGESHLVQGSTVSVSEGVGVGILELGSAVWCCCLQSCCSQTKA